MSDLQPSQRHPLLALATLILLMAGGSLIFGLLGLSIAGLVSGAGVFTGPKDPTDLKILQAALSLGTFVLPAWYFVRLTGQNSSVYFKFNTRIYPLTILLLIAVFFASAVPLNGLVELNKNMEFPEFLKGLEAWMRLKEEETAQLVKQFTVMNNGGDFLITLLILAVLPAFGEEMIFRGIIQKIFTQWTQSAHWGIWISAILFSAIHVQFFGFLPRMILGALFGYLFLWGNSLWLPILGHFLNNGTIVVLYYWQQVHGLSTDGLEDASIYSWYIYLMNTLLALTTLAVFYQYAKRTRLAEK